MEKVGYSLDQIGHTDIHSCEMNEDEVITLWIGAFRYYLGRKSYAVEVFCNLLVREWGGFPEDLQRVIRRELEKAFQEDDLERESGKTVFLPLGMNSDRKSWDRVRNLYVADIRRES